MRKRHHQTLAEIFAPTAPRSLSWQRLETLLSHLGARKIEGRGSRVRFELNGVIATFHRPHLDKQAKVYQVRDAQRFLENAGIKP